MTDPNRTELLAKLRVLLREQQRVTSDAAQLLEGVRVTPPHGQGSTIRLLGRISPACRLVAEHQVPSGRRTRTVTHGYALHTIVEWLTAEERCPEHESGGVQCELDRDHAGPCACPEALARAYPHAYPPKEPAP
jgi:hypothetical protein